MSGAREDERWMRRALRLAARGRTHPNPMVGCVLVRNGLVVGEGWHRRAGMPHAEAEALAAAGEAARGATAYVTLEPCAHYGRTPPCADALIRAGVGRVAAAMQDPNPLVAGRGFQRLREAGIPVEEGILREQAERLNAAYVHFHRTGLPYVTLKAAISLDGKTATRSGDSQWITSDAARRRGHEARSRAGAVLCGIGTALADNPLLTARVAGARVQPLRVVVDSHARLPPSSRLASTAHESPVLVFTRADAEESRVATLRECGIEVVPVASDASGRVALQGVVRELGARGIVSILVEGGGTLAASFVEARLANAVLWFIAPRLVGGRDAPTALEGCGVEALSAAVAVEEVRIHRAGPDIVVEGELKYP